MKRIVACALIALAAPAAAQAPGDTVMATPRGRYEAGWFHRWLLSNGHRSLWATPVPAEVLDLSTFAGGLTVTELGGGQQTRSLRFMGADGREYAFRSLDKDASRSLDPELRRSIAARVLQDQIGSLLPLSALVIDPLLVAAGVLHASPRLVVMPDDPRLGEFRAEFAGLLGWVEERPNEGFAASGRVVGSDRLFERLEESHLQRIDDRAYLRARLVDFLVGDWDRHPDQWRWAGYERGDTMVFEPIPRDRDWALARMDGLLVRMAAFAFPHYYGFSPDYPNVFRLTWSGRALDRRLLVATTRATFDSVAADLVARLPDRVIADAVAQLPSSYEEKVGPWLENALRRRRDALPRMAAEFYALLAGWVDVRATDEADVARIERMPDGLVRVTLAASGAPYYDRTFSASETEEVRVYLHGNADRAEVVGSGGGPRVRVIGGGGDDTLQATAGNVRFYDDRGANVVAGASLDTRPWVQPDDPASRTHMAPARDWGAYTVPVPYFTYDPDVGLFVGGGLIRWGYGFRHYPWKSRLSVSAGIGTATGRPRVQALYDFPLRRPSLRGLISARYSGAEADRFFGFGNDTEADSVESFYFARRQQIDGSLAMALRTGRVELAVGPFVRMLRPYDVAGTFLDVSAPDGAGDYDVAGVAAHVTIEARDVPRAARRGARIDLGVRAVPAMLDVVEPFAAATVLASGYVSAGGWFAPTLAVRAGAQKVSNGAPWHEAAFIGGSDNVRGFHTDRFAGDASLWGNVELRATLTPFFFLLPGHLGVFGASDAGRVWLDGESPGSWHTATGGGVWVSFISQANLLSVAVMSGEKTGVYIRAGFAF